MTPRRLRDAILESIVDLTRARPHELDGRTLTASEYAVYRKGYYVGVTMSLRVAQAAIDRFRVAVHARRAAARERRKAG